MLSPVRGFAFARWLWLAIDPVSKVIPSLHLGGRTYFYAITAHFGNCVRPSSVRKDHWHISDTLQHGMLIKRKHKNRKTFTTTRMAYCKRSDLFDY